jgi:molybdopterin synthase catalytic subunit
MRLFKGPMPIEAISEIIAKSRQDLNCGAHSLFIDQVKREQSDGKFLKAVEFSAYEEMVIQEANKINKTIISEYEGVRSIEIIHSTGLIKPGEISLVIMVSAFNHEHASKACIKAIELIKEKLPVLRKELYESDLGDSD